MFTCLCLGHRSSRVYMSTSVRTICLLNDGIGPLVFTCLCLGHRSSRVYLSASVRAIRLIKDGIAPPGVYLSTSIRGICHRSSHVYLSVRSICLLNSVTGRLVFTCMSVQSVY